jgi:hypothetical protein
MIHTTKQVAAAPSMRMALRSVVESTPRTGAARLNVPTSGT